MLDILVVRVLMEHNPAVPYKLEALPNQYVLRDIFMVIVYGRERDSERVAYVGREEQCM